MQDSKQDFLFDLYAARKYFEDAAAVDSTDERAHLYRALLFAVETELTAAQRAYVEDYYTRGWSMVAIAQEHGVDKSSVSRTLSRARSKLWRVLRYTSPRLLNADLRKRNLVLKSMKANWG